MSTNAIMCQISPEESIVGAGERSSHVLQLRIAQRIIQSQRKQLDAYENEGVQGAIALRNRLCTELNIPITDDAHTLIERHFRVFKSHRDIPLHYSTCTPHLAGPAVTVEDSDIWYSVYVIQPDGRVESVAKAYPEQWDEAVRTMILCGLQFHGDHCWHPLGIQIFAHHIGGYVDVHALHALTHRWWTRERRLGLEEL